MIGAYKKMIRALTSEFFLNTLSVSNIVTVLILVGPIIVVPILVTQEIFKNV